MTKEQQDLLISVAKAQQVLLAVQYELIRSQISQSEPLPIFALSRQIGGAQGDLDYSLRMLKENEFD